MATYPQTTNTANSGSVTWTCPRCDGRISYEPWSVACPCGYLQTDRGQLHFMPVSEH